MDRRFHRVPGRDAPPRPGNRILDVAAARGLAEVSIGRLHISQIRLVGIDLVVEKVIAALQETKAHNQRVAFAAADACRLPFIDGAFDSLFCMAVLQHIVDVETAVGEFARATVQNGRIMAVDPTTRAVSLQLRASGAPCVRPCEQFFAAAADARGERTDDRIGPKLPTLFAAHGIETIDVRLFPVSHTRLAPPPEECERTARRVQRVIERFSRKDVRELGRELLHAFPRTRRTPRRPVAGFVEIQHTMLFAAVGQKRT